MCCYFSFCVLFDALIEVWVVALDTYTRSETEGKNYVYAVRAVNWISISITMTIAVGFGIGRKGFSWC